MYKLEFKQFTREYKLINFLSREIEKSGTNVITGDLEALFSVVEVNNLKKFLEFYNEFAIKTGLVINDDGTTVFSLCDELKYSKDSFRITINPLLIPHYIEFNHRQVFSKLQIPKQANLIRVLKLYSYVEKQGNNCTLSLDSFKQLLGVEGKFPSKSHFKKNVIDVINELMAENRHLTPKLVINEVENNNGTIDAIEISVLERN